MKRNSVLLIVAELPYLFKDCLLFCCLLADELVRYFAVLLIYVVYGKIIERLTNLPSD